MTPYQLVSLADMLRLPIAKLIGSHANITDFARSTHDASIDRRGKNFEIPPAAFQDTLRHISDFNDACEQIGLEVTFRAGKEFLSFIKQAELPDGSGWIEAIDVSLFANHATVVSACLYHESDTKIAMTIPTERGKYFEPKKPLFGQPIADRFPEASEDIVDAGRCLAFGQGTATVMHLMRVLEVGLKALADALGIPYATSWESYLGQIQKQIAAKHATKTRKWIKSEKFFRDVSGDLMTIKQAWRNPTMHVDRKFYPDEAEVIFGAARTLMQTLAEGLPAKNKTGK